MKTAEKKIFTKAIEMNGTDEQMRVAQEECAELIQAISKYHRAQMSTDSRNKTHLVERSTKHLIEEIADVSIMIDQLKLMVKGDHSAIRAAKVERLAVTTEKGCAVQTAIAVKKPVRKAVKKARKPKTLEADNA